MTVSSRTPEGIPQRCPICGKLSTVEFSLPPGDSVCPSCGHLLWWLKDRLSHHTGVSFDEVELSTIVTDDSLDTIELVMELEEEFYITVSEHEAANLKTVKDVLQYIQRLRETNEPPDTKA
jgi:acyl carrier protein